MAATRLIALHANKGKSIARALTDRLDYAKNGEKTENGELVTAYACDPRTADEEFMLTKQEYLRITGRQPKGDIIAYQIRQSFKPGEITPEEANQVGYETAMRFTKGNNAFIVATHTDRAHIHNHIIFNSTNLACDRKFRDSWFIALALQRVSDLVCLEHRLSVIKPLKPSERAKRTEYPQKECFRSKICEDIDIAISKRPEDLEKLMELLREQKYEIKRGKYIAVRGEGQKRFIRLRSLGEGYTEQDLVNRLKTQDEGTRPRVQSGKRWKRPQKQFDLLIDIQEKMKQGKGGGYTKWATVYNLKQMAQTLLFLQEKGVRDYETLAKRAEDSSKRFDNLSASVKQSEKRLAEIATLRTHIINYARTRDVYVDYRKAGYSKKFFEEHREELTLHKAAKEAFSSLEGRKIPRVKELNEEYAEVMAKKKQDYAEYRQAKKEMQEYITAKHNVDSFLAIEENEREIRQRQEQERTR